MNEREKRELRQHKRKIKQLGNQRLRRLVKRELAEHPEDAHLSRLGLGEAGYGRFRSADFNGLDRDATRRRKGPRTHGEGPSPAPDAD